jgi:beta-lactamase regulating signal transducer with metallopeptidase domain
VIGLSYIVLVGEILLAAIFLVAVVAGIRSLVWKVVWPVAAGCLWYFAGAFYAFPLMIAVALRIRHNSGSISAESAREGRSFTQGLSTWIPTVSCRRMRRSGSRL